MGLALLLGVFAIAVAIGMPVAFAMGVASVIVCLLYTSDAADE